MILLSYFKGLNSTISYATTIGETLFPEKCGNDLNLGHIDNGFAHLLQQGIHLPGLTKGIFLHVRYCTNTHVNMLFVMF